MKKMRARTRKKLAQSSKIGTACCAVLLCTYFAYFLGNNEAKVNTLARIDKNETKLVFLATKRFG